MKLKLLDIVGNFETVKTGTCNDCFSTYDIEILTFIFNVDDCYEISVDARSEQDVLGCLDELPEIDNIIDFADFVSKKDFEVEPIDFDDLYNLIEEYNKKHQNK